jgi:hypothetical protein
MQKWEYRLEIRSRNLAAVATGYQAGDWDRSMATLLATAGEEGWELVSVIARSGLGGEGRSGVTTEELWVLKRPKD